MNRLMFLAMLLALLVGGFSFSSALAEATPSTTEESFSLTAGETLRKDLPFGSKAIIKDTGLPHSGTIQVNIICDGEVVYSNVVGRKITTPPFDADCEIVIFSVFGSGDVKGTINILHLV